MSADSVKAQKNFCDKQSFPFQLLSDPDKSTIQAYEAWGKKKMYGREYEGIFRYSYLIDEKGMIEDIIEKVKSEKQEIIDSIQTSGKLEESTEKLLTQLIEEYKKNKK